MKILWVSHFLPYPDTGYGALQRSRNLLRSACSHHDVTLATLPRGAVDTSPEALERANADLKRFCKAVHIVSEAPPNAMSKFGALARSLITSSPYSVEWFRSTELRKLLERLLGEERFDLIHADTLGLCEYLLDRASAPIVLNHHNVESAMMERRAVREKSAPLRTFMRREATMLRAFERRYCPKFALHIAVSDPDRAELIGACGRSPVTVIENPVDCGYWTAKTTVVKSAEILLAGGLDWYPNVDAATYFFEEVWPELSRTRPAATVTVVGRLPADSPLPGRFSSSRVTFTGFVDDVRPYFARARLLACPMRDGGGTKLKIVDSLAAGLPIVSTSFGCFGLELVDGEHFLLADDPAAFVSQSQRLLDDDSLSTTLSKNGRALVETRYSAESLGKRLLSAYESVIAR